jgi:hypothetical protein
MNYRTLAEGFAQDADGTIFDFGSLYERLSGLRNSRQRWMVTLFHPRQQLTTVVTLLSSAII